MYKKTMCVLGLFLILIITTAQAADQKTAPRLSAEGKALLTQVGQIEREVSRGLAGTEVRMRRGTSARAEVRIQDVREYQARLHQLEQKIRALDRYSQQRVRRQARALDQKIQSLKKASENLNLRDKQKSQKQRMTAMPAAKKAATPRAPREFIGIVPPNDLCSNATSVGEGTFAGDTSSATNDGSESCVGEASEDIWYQYTATSTGLIRVDTVGSDFDTVLSVHTPPCPGNTGNEIVCNDDCVNVQSCVTFSAVAGNSYLVRVGGYSIGETGPITLNIALTGGITGKVTDADAPVPLSGIYVEIYDEFGDYVSYDYTSASGEYAAGGIPTGTYYAIAYADGAYLDELYNNVPCPNGNCSLLTGTPIAVTAGETTSGIDFALEQGGRISGTVTDSETGLPIEYAEIDIYDATGDFVGYAYTDGAGEYLAEGLPTGSYRARTYSYSDYVDELYDNISCSGYCDPASGTPIPVTQPDTTPGINFALNPMGRISGTVTNESTGVPISDVEVDIVDENGDWMGYGYTDSSGNYTARGLPGGNYFVLTYNYSGYLDELYNDIPCPFGNCDVWSGTPVAVAESETTPGINFALKVGGKISGVITDDYSGLPLANTRVRVYDQQGEYVSYDYTNDSGVYTAGGLPTGSYFVQARNYDGYIGELYDNMTCPFGNCDPTTGTPVPVTVSQMTVDIDFGLVMGGRIIGRVMNSTSQPLEYVEVNIYDSADEWVDYGYTDVDGYYAVRGLPTGTYFAVTYNYDGYMDELYNNIPCPFGCDPTSGTPISVTAGQTTNKIGFVLDIGGSISGALTDASTGEALMYEDVEIFDTNGDYVSYGYTDELGEYTAAGLPTGTYYAATDVSYYSDYIDELYNNISCPWYCDPTTGTPIQVTVSQVTPGIDFALDVGGSISGTVTDEDNSLPIRDIGVDIVNSDGWYVGYGYTDGAGRYTTGGLPSGLYRAAAYGYYSDYLGEVYYNIPCSPSGYCDPEAGTPFAVTLSQETAGIDFSLTRGGSVSGTITDADSGAPIAGASVVIYDYLGNSAAYGYTNSIGHYTAGGLPTGTYYAIASEDSQYVPQLYQGLPCPFKDCDPTTGLAISVTVSQDTPGINFALDMGGSIHGKITSSATGNPIADVGIEIYNATGQWAGYAYVDYDGDYSVGGLPAGSYYVRTENWSGYVDELYNNMYCPNGYCDVLQGTPVAVTLGEDTNNIDFALDRQARIRGTVRDVATQQPLEYVYVEIFDTNTNLVAYGYTDDYGRYLAGGLPAGSYYAKTYEAYGYQDEMYDNVPCPDGVCSWGDGTLIVLTAGAFVSGIDFDLEPADDSLYADEFDDEELPTDWSYTKAGWSEWGGNLVGVPPAKKTAAVASPAFAGCSECSFEGTLETAGGDTAKLWMLAWYQDKKNTFELLMNETGDRWLLKQRVNGAVVQKAKAAKAIEPNTPYLVRMLFDGVQVLVYVDDMTTPLITLTPSGLPMGTAGFAVKNTIGTFDYLHIEQ